MIYDLVIVGMGPAGIGAAIYAKRAGLNILCLDQAMIGGYLNFIDRIDNYPGMYGVTGPDFAYKLFEHINSSGHNFNSMLYKRFLCLYRGLHGAAKMCYNLKRWVYVHGGNIC